MSHVPCSSAVRSIIYAMICPHPDISHVINVVSRYMYNPEKVQWKAVKWILQYLRGIAAIGLIYHKDGEKGCKLVGDWIHILQVIWIIEDL